jgi:hypothetical protein
VTRTSSDAAEPTTPPAFPEWLKRMFPTLRAEETNMLFQAFRERRLRTRGGWLKRRIPSASMRVAVGLVIAAGVVVLGWWALSTMSRIKLMILLGPMMMIGGVLDMLRRSQLNRPDRATMPMYLHEVFGVRTFASDAAIDVYMTGASARDVIEAIYLELYSQSWRTLIAIAGALFTAACFGIYVLAVTEDPWHMLQLFSATIAGFFGVRYILLFGHVGIFSGAIAPRIDEWRRPTSIQDRILRTTTAKPTVTPATSGQVFLFLALAAPAVGILLTIAVSAVAYLGLVELGVSRASIEFLKSPEIGFTAVLPTLALVCAIEYGRWADQIPKDFDALANRAAEPYRLMIERIVEGNRE